MKENMWCLFLLPSTLLRQDLFCFGCYTPGSPASNNNSTSASYFRVVGMLGLTDTLYEGPTVRLAFKERTFTHRTIFLGLLRQCLSGCVCVSISLSVLRQDLTM